MSNDYINSYEQKKELFSNSGGEHPVWRGIGCVLVTIVPVFSYLLARFLVDQSDQLKRILLENYFFSKSVDLMNWDQMIVFFIPSSNDFFLKIRESLGFEPIPYFWGTLLIGLILSFIIFSIISLTYSITRRKANIYNKSKIDIILNKQKKKKSKSKK